MDESEEMYLYYPEDEYEDTRYNELDELDEQVEWEIITSAEILAELDDDADKFDWDSTDYEPSERF